MAIVYKILQINSPATENQRKHLEDTLNKLAEAGFRMTHSTEDLLILECRTLPDKWISL
jgi:hypothetical protein